ncbi:hypothetical protein KC734_09000 [candidate division KSB1 bacterium]|nr:hypothetical protein [candidate division KSB1 bacterium]
MSFKSFFSGIFAIIRGLIYLAVAFIILAILGDYFISRDAEKKTAYQPPLPPVAKPIPKKVIPWHEVDAEVKETLFAARAEADTFAAGELQAWHERLMVRVDHDFLEWYFDYWNQQAIGFKGLYQTILNSIDESYPTAAEKITEEIQYEFAQRVLHPQLAQLELERITRETVNVYVENLRLGLEGIPEQYTIPKETWDRYLNGIAVITAGAEGNRTVSLSMKAITASSVGGAILLAKPVKVAAGKIGMKYSSRLAAKSTAKIAAKTGEKVASKSGGKLLGPIIGLGIIIWDAIDHEKTRAEAEPILRENIRIYLLEVKDQLLHDTENGVMAVVHEIETSILQSLVSKPALPDSVSIEADD